MIPRLSFSQATYLLIAIAIAIGAYNLLFSNETPLRPSPPRTTWAYAVDEEDISQVTIRQGVSKQHYRKIKQQWFQEAADGVVKVDSTKWGAGIPLLLSGPSVSRVLTGNELHMSEYGLESAEGEIHISLRGNRSLRIAIGNYTPDFKHRYLQVNDRKEIGLVPASWADLLLKFATRDSLPTQVRDPHS